MIETIHIYHTNDIHSHFESWPQIRRLFSDRKSIHTQQGEACYIFDIGDHVDRSHPFTEGTNGKGNVSLLNDAGYDVVTIGNNEGITMSKDSLASLYESAQFDIVVGNLFEKDGSIPSWLKPFKILKTNKGTRIGVIGVTAAYIEFYNQLGWSIQQPREAVRKLVDYLEPMTDLIICLSHLGLTEDEKMASACPEINLILGGHTHHYLPEGKKIGQTLLAAAGKFGNYIGSVKIQFDVKEKRVSDIKANLITTNSLPTLDEDINHLNELMSTGQVLLEKKVFYNEKELVHELFQESPLSSLFGNALLAYTNADCALFNAGIFLGSLDAGWVTEADLHALLPHSINPCIVTLDGAQLVEIFHQSLQPELANIHVKGLGFRGDRMGALIHKRLYQNSSGQLFIGDEEIATYKQYKLATLDMFTFGFFFPLLKDADIEYIMPDLLRDVFAWYGREGENIKE